MLYLLFKRWPPFALVGVLLYRRAVPVLRFGIPGPPLFCYRWLRLVSSSAITKKYNTNWHSVTLYTLPWHILGRVYKRVTFWCIDSPFVACNTTPLDIEF